MAYIRSNTVCVYIGLARIIYIRCINDFNCREITKYTVKYGVYVRFWRTLCGRPRAKPPGSFRLLTLQKKSFPTQLSAPKTVEWLGRYAQFRGIGLFARGGGGGAWGWPCMYSTWEPYVRFGPTLHICLAVTLCQFIGCTWSYLVGCELVSKASLHSFTFPLLSPLVPHEV